MKTCAKCKCTKELSEFYVRRGVGDGFQRTCKICSCLIAKEDYENNPEKYAKKEKERYAKDPEFYKAKTANWREQNPDKVIEYHKQWYANNKEYSIQQAREWNDAHPEQFRANLRRSNKKKRGTSEGQLNHCISSAVRHSLKNGAKASRHWEELVNFTIAQLRNHLEKLFTPEMNWENYGSVWEIDHKIPISVHNFERPEDLDFRLCWSLKNLQPLGRLKNRSKSNKIDKPFQSSLAIAV